MNLDVESHIPGKKFSVKLVVISLVAAAAYFNTTLAANVSLGSGSLEFGQGIQITSACSGNSALTITPQAKFVNTSGGGDYYFSGYTISNIPISCYGVDFQVNAYGETSSATIDLYSNTSKDSIIYNNNGNFEVNGSVVSGTSVTTNSTGSYAVTFTNPVSKTGAVAKLTLQSGAHKSYCASGSGCALGEVGPGGGTIFYISSTAFTETGTACSTNCHYLEAAPATWYSGSGDPTQYWWLDSDYTFSPNGDDLGFGFVNTEAIVARRNSNTDGNASSRDYQGGGKSDWFLPSIGELQLMFNNKSSVGGLQSGDYWSSSQFAWYLAKYINMGGGNVGQIHRYNTKYIRPIRAF